MPEVTVIIPTYNRAHCLTDALNSVLQQSFRDFVVVVVDDGSTDNTREVLRPYMNRIRYIHQANAGVSAARNRGIRESQTPYVAFLDSDDEWSPDKLRVQVQAMATAPRLVAHAANAQFADEVSCEDTSYLRSAFPIVEPASGVLERPLPYANIGMTQAILCRREAAIAAGMFNEGLSICEDHDFACRLALQGPWAYCWQTQLTVIRRQEHTVNLSADRVSNPIRTFGTLCGIYRDLLSRDGLLLPERQFLVSMLHRSLHGYGTGLLRAGRLAEARTAFGQACRMQRSLKSAMGYLLACSPRALAQFLSQTWSQERKQTGAVDT